MSLHEIIGYLIVHELRLKEGESHEEDHVLLVKALSRAKKSSKEESSLRGRGRHLGHGRGRCRGRGRGRNQPAEEDNENKPFDKSAIQCYNC